MCCFGCATFSIITGFQFLVNKEWTTSSQQLLFVEPLQQARYLSYIIKSHQEVVLIPNL